MAMMTSKMVWGMYTTLLGVGWVIWWPLGWWVVVGSVGVVGAIGQLFAWVIDRDNAQDVQDKATHYE